MKFLIFTASIAAIILATPAKAADQDVACATLPTYDGCIACGAQKYGLAAQQTYCQKNWKPGQIQTPYEQYRREGREAPGQTGCDYLPTYDACVACGAQTHGVEAQQTWCRANWKRQR